MDEKEDRVVDLMAALEESVADAKEARLKREEQVEESDENLDEFPFGRCRCGGAYDQRGFCVDKCARESYYNG